MLYLAIIFLMRLMGKRQIGELQPSELVVTILLSEIASIPMQDNRVPILHSIVALFALVAYEIFSSVLCLKSSKTRSLIQGNSVIVIRDGKIDIKALRKLRMSIGDLMSLLRQKDVFDISVVSYAIFETNGKLSVLLKPESRNSTAKDLGIFPADDGMPFTVVCDGKIVKETLEQSQIEPDKIKKLILSSKIPLEDIMVMTVGKDGITFLARKDDTN